MIGIPEDIGIVGHADRRIFLRREAGARNDDIDGAQLQALIDIGFLAELRGRVDFDLVAAVGALGDLLAGPYRFGMEGLGDLIDMGPFKHFLGVRRSCH